MNKHMSKVIASGGIMLALAYLWWFKLGVRLIRSITFETPGRTLEVRATCPKCLEELGPVHMTVYMKDYTYEDCQSDLISGHKAWGCKAGTTLPSRRQEPEG